MLTVTTVSAMARIGKEVFLVFSLIAAPFPQYRENEAEVRATQNLNQFLRANKTSSPELQGNNKMIRRDVDRQPLELDTIEARMSRK